MPKMIETLTESREIPYSGDWTDITLVVAPKAMLKAEESAIAFVTARAIVMNAALLHEPLKRWLDLLIKECDGVHDDISHLTEIRNRLDDDGVSGVCYMAANIQYCWV
jgi:hypothetical protein